MRDNPKLAAICLLLALTTPLGAEQPARPGGPAPVAAQAVTPRLSFAIDRLDRGDWRGAFHAGKLAFADADTDAQRYHSARVTAIAALSLDKPLATRFWLRRAGDTAPGPVEAAKVQRNYRMLQARTPWRYRFRFGVRQSDNVNGGASSETDKINGYESGGILSTDAQALPGVIATTHASVSRRIHRNKRAQTLLRADLMDHRVRLSGSPERRVFEPGSVDDFVNERIRSREFDRTELGFSVAHTRAGLRPGWASFGSIGVAQNWHARARYHQSIEVDIGQRMTFGDALSLRLTAGAGRKFYEAGGRGDTLQFGGTLGYALRNGGKLALSLSVQDEDARLRPFDSRTQSAQLSYRLGKPVLGMTARASLGVSRTHYDAWRSFLQGFGFFRVAGGRTDDSVFGALDLTLDEVTYAGFAPRVTLRAADTTSNISRFTTQELSVSFGISSAF